MSERKVIGWSNPWARHYLATWHERSGDSRLPMWLRVSCLAYGAHAANGHALFRPGDVALVLGTVDPATGEIRPMQKANVQRTITQAVEYGWLAPGSSALCLVVPGHAIQGGKGDPGAKCPQEARHRERAATVDRQRQLHLQVVNE